MINDKKILTIEEALKGALLIEDSEQLKRITSEQPNKYWAGKSASYEVQGLLERPEVDLDVYIDNIRECIENPREFARKYVPLLPSISQEWLKQLVAHEVKIEASYRKGYLVENNEDKSPILTEYLDSNLSEEEMSIPTATELGLGVSDHSYLTFNGGRGENYKEVRKKKKRKKKTA